MLGMENWRQKKHVSLQPQASWRRRLTVAGTWTAAAAASAATALGRSSGSATQSKGAFIPEVLSPFASVSAVEVQLVSGESSQRAIHHDSSGARATVSPEHRHNRRSHGTAVAGAAAWPRGDAGVCSARMLTAAGLALLGGRCLLSGSSASAAKASVRRAAARSLRRAAVPPNASGGAADKAGGAGGVQQAEPQKEEKGKMEEPSEVDKLFMEAYNTEVERAELLQHEIEKALEKMMETDFKVSMEVPETIKPTPGMTWKERYEAAKDRTGTLEALLEKVKGRAATAGASGEATAPVFEPIPLRATESAKAFESTAEPSKVVMGGEETEWKRQMEDIEGQLRQELEAVQEVDGVLAEEVRPLLEQILEGASLSNIRIKIDTGEVEAEEDMPVVPKVERLREVLGDSHFRINRSWYMGKGLCVFLQGQLQDGVEPGRALDEITKSFKAQEESSDEIEIFICRTSDERQYGLLFAPTRCVSEGEFAWWQEALVVISIFACGFFFGNGTIFLANPAGLPGPIADDVVVPIAASVIATFVAQEFARRVAAHGCGVEFTPPTLAPSPQTALFGALSRNRTPFPNKDAELSVYVATGLAGFLTSGALIAFGLSQAAADPAGSSQQVLLNFRDLPLVLKFLLKPVLGTNPITEVFDPFQDPVTAYFPANPITIGGIVGLVLTCLNLLPIGKLDGAHLMRGSFGVAAQSSLGFLTTMMIIFPVFLTPDGATIGDFYLGFALFLLFFQDSATIPPWPRDTVSDANPLLKVLAGVIAMAACLLAIPACYWPNI